MARPEDSLGVLSVWDLSWRELGQAATPGVLIGIFLGVVWRYAVVTLLPLAFQAVCLVSGGVGIALGSLFLIATDLDYAIEQKGKLGPRGGDALIVEEMDRKWASVEDLWNIYDFVFHGSDSFLVDRPEQDLKGEMLREFLARLFRGKNCSQCGRDANGVWYVLRGEEWWRVASKRGHQRISTPPEDFQRIWTSTSVPGRVSLDFVFRVIQNWAFWESFCVDRNICKDDPEFAHFIEGICSKEPFTSSFHRLEKFPWEWRREIGKLLRFRGKGFAVREADPLPWESDDMPWTKNRTGFLLFQNGSWTARLRTTQGDWEDDCGRPCAPPTAADMPHVWAYWE